MRTKAAVVEWIKPCCCRKNMKMELKSQQPWTAISASLDAISMAQLADKQWVPKVIERKEWGLILSTTVRIAFSNLLRLLMVILHGSIRGRITKSTLC